MGDFILAIDQGTTSSRALVVDREGAVRGVGQEQFPQYFPRPGRVEHNADEIWKSTEDAIAEALAAAGVAPRDLAGIGITNQRETIVAWERATGRPVAPAIVWQDRRTAGECDALRSAGHEARVAHLTGLTLDPYFSATKLRWLLQSVPGLRSRAESGEVAVGTIDSWLVWNLTGGARHVTDYTNASRTLLFNIRRGRWDDELLTLFDIPRAALPAALPSRAHFGNASADVIGAQVPILAVAGDQQSALFGQACLAPGQAKNTYGTGCFLLANAGRQVVESSNRLLVSMGAGAGKDGPEYVIEGSVFVAGSLIQWLCEGLRLFENQGEVEALAATVPDANGVTIVPALTGLGAPYWDPEARGAILGLTRGTSRAHIARAALEAIALSSAELALAMDGDLPRPISELRVDGGAARNDLLMQMQADTMGVPVIRPRNVETTAMGAAYLAGIQAGTWANADEVAALWQPDRVFEPKLPEDDRQEILAMWRSAVGRVLTRGGA